MWCSVKEGRSGSHKSKRNESVLPVALQYMLNITLPHQSVKLLFIQDSWRLMHSASMTWRMTRQSIIAVMKWKARKEPSEVWPSLWNYFQISNGVTHVHLYFDRRLEWKLSITGVILSHSASRTSHTFFISFLWGTILSFHTAEIFL